MMHYLIERRYGRHNRDYLTALTHAETTWTGRRAAAVFLDAGTAYAALGLVAQLSKSWPNRTAFAFAIVQIEEVRP